VVKLGDLADVLQPLVDVGFKALFESFLTQDVLEIIYLADGLVLVGFVDTTLHLHVHYEVYAGNRKVLTGLSKMHFQRGELLQDDVEALACLLGCFLTCGLTGVLLGLKVGKER
jgi:hypothetical protein